MSRWSQFSLGELPRSLSKSVLPSAQPDELFELYSVPAHERGAPELVRGADIGSNKQTVAPGMVLLCKINPRINRVWVVGPYSGIAQIASTEWIAFDPIDGLSPQYLALFLRQHKVRDYLAANASGVGGSLMRVRPATLDAVEVSAPAGDLQARIVDAVEALESGLCEAVSELLTAKRKLSLYRQSLLKSAVEGALTAEYRQAFSSSDNRTLTTTECQSNGPWPLPATWRWSALDSLICDGPQNGLYLPADRYGTGVSILRIDDYQIGRVPERTALRQVRADEADALRYALNTGDLVINRVNSVTHLGKCIAVPPSLAGALFESNMMRLHLREGLRPRFVASYLGSAVGRALLIKNAKWAVNQASINQQDVRNTPVPVPPHDEQVEIERLLELHLAAVSDQAAVIDEALAMASAQRQNILRAAFSGQLVPQDPSDEPASVLLERIREHREAAAPVAKRKPGRPVKAAA